MTKQPIEIAIVDNDYFYHQLIRNSVEQWGDHPLRAKYSLNITSFFDSDDFSIHLVPPLHLVILDYYTGGHEKATTILRAIKRTQPDAKVIVVSEEQSLKTSVLPLLNGADHFVQKEAHFIYALDKHIANCLNGILSFQFSR